MTTQKPWTSRGMLLSLAVAALVAGGCASYPISKDLRQQAKPVTLREARQNPSTHKGSIVIWGGKIIKTVNHTNGAEIYVMQVPLNRYERPILHGSSSGRFIVKSPEFLDPEIYRHGRVITVAGEITGQQTEPVDAANYTYPVLRLRQLRFWRLVRNYYVIVPAWSWRYSYWGYPGWGYSWEYPYWGWGEPYWAYPPRWDRDWGMDRDREPRFEGGGEHRR